MAVMEHRAISSIREIVRVAFIGTLVLLFIAETVIAQDAPFLHPVAVLVLSGIAAVLSWYGWPDRQVT
ncbi:MAG TPA: hypothetical protein VFG28_14845 [Syntrophales bacterium]|nr:hypothetical protein [Syntrophales bacterium]